MKIFGLAGWSGSGKTTLVARLLPALIGRGLTVSTLKHAHHSFDVDQPGKDSWLHRQAGAQEVMVSSANRWALMHEHRGAPESGLDAPGDLLVDGDRIVAIGPGLADAGLSDDVEIVEVGGLCLAPGLVDMRVQLREPGAEHMESIESGGFANGSSPNSFMFEGRPHR